MRRGLAVVVSVAALLPAQDPDTLLGVQAALQRATARVAPSVVRIETFGGVRRDPSAPASPITDGARWLAVFTGALVWLFVPQLMQRLLTRR